jgi:cell division cycle 2-like protein
MNTPGSRKRSRWNESDELEEQPPNITIPKRKRQVTPPLPANDRTSLPAASTSQLPPVRTGSIHVPPRTAHPPLTSSRSVYNYERLNQIEEGSYGIVFRARDKETGDIVALKKLKLDDEKFGFPITSLREINALMSCRHENVVNIREIVVGDTLTQ